MKPGVRRDVARWLHAEHSLSQRRAAFCCSISSGCYRYTSRRQPDDEIVEGMRVSVRPEEKTPDFAYLWFDPI